MFITHDMGSIASMADRVIVMYAGRCVEAGTTQDILLDPRHPYTKGLIACIPHLNKKNGKKIERLNEIPGIVPAITQRGKGCALLLHVLNHKQFVLMKFQKQKSLIVKGGLHVGVQKYNS